MLIKRNKTSFVGWISDSVIQQDHAILLGYAALTQPTKQIKNNTKTLRFSVHTPRPLRNKKMQKKRGMGNYWLNPQITQINTDKNNMILICVNLRNLWINMRLKKDKITHFF